MKRSICCLVVLAFALGMQANGKNGIKLDDRRGMCVPADVEKGWQKRTIKVPGKKSDIVTLFEAFYKVWPTIESSRIVQETNVNFHVLGGNDFVCYYDFDPVKRTLTPEESPVKREHLKSPEKSPLWYDLPHQGKTMTVVEDGGSDAVVINYYEFDGQNLKFSRQETQP